MSVSSIFARIVALIGAAAVAWRRLQGDAHEPAVGSAPAIPAAKPQGSIPTLKMPTAKGWAPGQISGRGARLEGQCFRIRSQAPPLDQRAAQRRRACRGGAERGTARQKRLRLRHGQYDETRCRHGG